MPISLVRRTLRLAATGSASSAGAGRRAALASTNQAGEDMLRYAAHSGKEPLPGVLLLGLLCAGRGSDTVARLRRSRVLVPSRSRLDSTTPTT